MTVNAAHLVSWLSVYVIHHCWVCAGLGRALWPFHGCLQSLCIFYQGWNIARKMFDTMFVPRTAFDYFTLPPLACSQRYKDTELLRNTWGHSEEFVHVSVTWCRCVLMDRTFTGPRGCQSQIMPESCLGYMLLFRCFTSVCTGSNFINVCRLCVVVV